MRYILLAVVAFIAAAACQAGTIYINADASGDYPTIQAAINASNQGDVLILRPGTYIGAGNMEIDCNGKNITIQSTDPCDPAIVGSTIIDCQRRGRAIKFVKGESSTLAGLTIINGALLPLPNNKGGTAVYCENSSPTISNCTIKKCYVSSPDYFNSAIRCVKSDVNLLGCTVAEIPDAGIDLRDSNAVIAGCTITANTEGISTYDTNTVISDCTISNNRYGIGLYGYSPWQGAPTVPIVNNAEISDSIITGNGSGISCTNMNLSIERSTVSDNNMPSDSTGISGIKLQFCNTLVNDCIIAGNKSRYSSSVQYNAGGLANISGTLEMNNCDISGNSAIYGGGITNYQGNALIKNCRITNNTAGGNFAGTQYLAGSGGGIYDYEGTQLTIEDCTITGNKTIGYPTAPSAGSGGGISSSNQQIITVKNCIITDNKSNYGGGIYAGYISIGNCILSHNEAQAGGGIYNSGSVSRFENCTFAANKAVRGGAIIGTGVVTNCIFWDEIIPSQSQWRELSGSFSVSYSDIHGGYSGQGEGNIDVDPQFIFASDFHLSSGSPCIDAGVNTLPLPDELPAEDLDGNPRVIDGNSEGVATVDMGAYEFNSEISRLAVSDSQFLFSCAKNGPAPEPKTFLIRNCGGGILNWQISENCPWLNLSSQSGTSNGSASQVILTVDTALLEPGIYNTDLLVSAQDSAGSPRTIGVILRVGRLLSVPQNFKTIQSAIDDANNFDWVFVADGTYTGPGNRDIDFRGKAVTVISQNGPETCIIDCKGRPDDFHRGFIFGLGETADSILDGFTITNGFDDFGSAILLVNGSPSIKNCVFSKNIANNQGGALCTPFPPPPPGQNFPISVAIENCSFNENSAIEGGAIFFSGTLKLTDCSFSKNFALNRGGALTLGPLYDTLINRCTFKENSATGGGAISVASSGNTSIVNSVITGNTAKIDAGAIFSMIGNVMLSNTLVAGNRALHGGAAAFRGPSQIYNCTFADNFSPDGQILYFAGALKMRNSIVKDNFDIIGNADAGMSIYFCNLFGDLNKNGNICADPCFVQPGHWDPNDTPDDANDDFWIEGDYRLLPTSPCINAGDPNYKQAENETDLDGNPRVALGRIDMGAYEFINALPVACSGPNQVAYAWIDGIAEVMLDGSASYDADGDELSYLWTWSIDANTYELPGVKTSIDLPVGLHTIELVVNDGFEDSEPNYVDINVIGPIKGTLLISPQIIHRYCEQKRIMAMLQLPQGITKDQVDVGRKLRLYPGQVEAENQFLMPSCANGVRKVFILAWFDRDEILEAIGGNCPVRVYVAGQFKTGQIFYGSDTMRIINPGHKPKWGNFRQWFHNWNWNWSCQKKK